VLNPRLDEDEAAAAAEEQRQELNSNKNNKMLLQQLRRNQLCSSSSSSSSVVQVVAAVLCLVAAGAISYVEAAVQYYDWTVAYTYASPDCVEKLVIAVNGEFPGPRIDATEGDTVVVNLTNLLPTEGVVIHWHGMHQVGTPYYDGTASVSQCTINSGETFTYSFIVDRVSLSSSMPATAS
jgi:hypothetical protein